jgi:NAD(P)-dependent dehydrogenase (short-subunit alcohol dehydrogenase family)
VEGICEYLEISRPLDLTKVQEINLRGLYLMSHYFIQSQPNPKEPTGTLITVASGRAGLTIPGGSAYNISKLAEERLNEHIQMGENNCPSSN